jgi:clan AA aspartic protease (TIGR02281 family)
VPRADRVPFLAGHPLVAVRVAVNDLQDVVMIIDSGAGRTLISRSVALVLGLDLRSPLRREALAGVGQSLPVPVVRLDRVQVGSSVVQGLEASVFDMSPAIRAEGLLGLNFLRRFRVTFAFDAGVVILRDPPPRRAGAE